MAKIRLFIAIDVNFSDKINELCQNLKNSKTNIKIVEPENVHLTLKFLGDTNENLLGDIEDIIKTSIEDIKPFNLRLKSIGCFPNQNYIKILWIGIEKSEKLKIIAEKIDGKTNKIGFKKEIREFSPHLTIARVRSAKNKENLIKIINKYNDVEFGNINVSDIKIIKSTLTRKGPIYEVLKQIEI